jgi:photosystem I reaction center subunit XII
MNLSDAQVLSALVVALFPMVIALLLGTALADS